MNKDKVELTEVEWTVNQGHIILATPTLIDPAGVPSHGQPRK
jgi:hypothetical protein